MEVHVQLTTKSKIFCTCSNAKTDKPNTNICQICAGHPGVLPVLNKQVVEKAIFAGLATQSSISSKTDFARKHYFYPDLPKGFQTTQSTRPICTEGLVRIRLENNQEKDVRLIRIHMEEDAGKNIHAGDQNESFVDLNRAGTPLLEIVSYPDIASTAEAKAYLKSLRNIVVYLGICTGNMEDGNLRADTNISVRKKGSKQLGTRCELKNINSFKFIGDAIEFEIERQIELIKSGGTVKQETRLWDTKAKQTVPMRSKEEAADYRYFTEPDLPILKIDQIWIERVRARMPELPNQKYTRLMNEFSLSSYEADILVNDRQLAQYYEQTAKINSSKQTINWILRDVMSYLKAHKMSPAQCKVTPTKLAQIISMLEEGTINSHAAKTIFETIAETGQTPETVMNEKGLKQIGSTEDLEKIVIAILKEHPDMVQAYKEGKDKLFGFFVGQAMQKTQGKGSPQIIQALLKKHLV